MDVSALALKIDSDTVVTAANNLDRFSASADKAAASAGKVGSDARLPQGLSRSAQSAAAAAASVDKYSSSAVRAAQAANQASTSIANTATAVTRLSVVTQQADAHVIAYRNNLERLATANKAAAGASGTAAAQVTAVGAAGKATSAILTGLGGILGGLIGMIVGSLIGAIVDWVASLWDADDALKAVTVGSDNLGTAQAALGQMFDLSTGKIKNNTQAIRDNLYMQQIALEASAIKAKADAATALSDSGVGRTTGLSRAGRRLAGFFTQENPYVTEIRLAQREARGRSLEDLMTGVAQGGISRAEAGKRLEDLRKSFDLTQKQYYGVQNALNRAYEQFTAGKGASDIKSVLDGAGLPSEYLQPKTSRSTRARSGGKSDADRLADLLRNAKEAITVEENRAKAVDLSANATAELEQRTKLLNAAASAGLKITPSLTTEIDRLSKAYADAKVSADVSEVVKSVTDDIDKQRAAIADETSLIGLYGDALARARREMEAHKKIREALPKGEIVAVGGNLTGDLSDEIEAQNRSERLEKIRRDRELSTYALDLERRSLGLTGAAALEYAYITERLNEAKRQGIELSPAEIAAINAAGKAYADQRHAIDQQAQAIADARDVAKGFFSEWTRGALDGENVFKAFANSVINALNRIIDRMLDRTFDSFFSKFAGGGGGGFFDKLLNFGLSAIGGGGGFTGDGAPGNAGGMDLRGFHFANGGAFDRAQRFASGGTFTNSIVTSPTLFRFAKGTKLGEMGEDGPEAIMPLTRGPDGKLGVAAHGGSGRSVYAPVSVQNDYHIQGAVTPNDIIAMIRQGSAATQAEVKRQLGGWLQEYERDGAVAV